MSFTNTFRDNISPHTYTHIRFGLYQLPVLFVRFLFEPHSQFDRSFLAVTIDTYSF